MPERNGAPAAPTTRETARTRRLIAGGWLRRAPQPAPNPQQGARRG